MFSGRGMKGITVTNEMFWTIIIVVALILLLAVWLLLTGFFVDFTLENINTQERICETFEKVPLLGGCPGK